MKFQLCERSKACGGEGRRDGSVWPRTEDEAVNQWHSGTDVLGSMEVLYGNSRQEKEILISSMVQKIYYFM